MRELDYKESWAPKNWCFWTVVLEKTLEGPLDCKEIQPVNPKGDHSWIFIGRTDVEAETPILGPPDAKNWLISKDPDAGKNWKQEKGMTEDEMAGWHHQCNGHKMKWVLGVGDGQGGLACCSPWGRKESDVTEWLNWTDANRWLIGKVSDAGKDGGQKKRASEDEMAGWHHQCNGHELWQPSGDGEGQGDLACCSLWGREESDTTGWLNSNRWFTVLQTAFSLGPLLVHQNSRNKWYLFSLNTCHMRSQQLIFFTKYER